ncbi:alpha,alpha-trehalase TreF [Pseudorhodoferax sp.]|uniref:alpha,alpha-trehalase TreF n=1 Tax=Pseudorhodoferax sp. TaxID=1993553 RepID=UPI002DD659BC|nr:alpha,alpha-trehalase TreF [Pseudorhodoferax sp.]
MQRPTSPASGIHTEPAERHAAAERRPPPDTQSPADRYAELFEAVQREAVFADSKTFPDCAPLGAPQDILAAYRQARTAPGFELRAFVAAHFAPQRPALAPHGGAPAQDLRGHIDRLWDELTRHPDQHPHRGSLLALPHPYVVPGGRFVEMYYWDSYFTMLGLAASGRAQLLHAMTDNFAYLIDRFGHVPNGTRTYYLSRSQPPLFACMVALCEGCGGQGALRYLPQLQREHAFWMDGADQLAPGAAQRRVVRLSDGALLNRYWDARDTPREEAWREDVATAAAAPQRPAAEVFRDLRAAAESGWDFSSRWLARPAAGGDRLQALASIRTTRIVPVDLNALLHRLERSIAELATLAGDSATAQRHAALAEARRAAMDRWLWNAQAGAWLDLDWPEETPRTGLNAATCAPLFTRSASPEQARRVADTLARRLLVPGGLATTEQDSEEQWDRPNGWAPLQWMAADGLAAYGCDALAGEIRARWLRTVRAVYQREHRLVEKYALGAHPDGAAGGSGGEYPLQDGFGWTNGVTRQWLDGG